MRRTKSKPTRRSARNQSCNKSVTPEKLPFIAHIQELRRRFFYVGISVAVFGAAAASIQSQLSDALLKPAGSQQFIYTTPGGGFDYAFKLCLYSGLAASIPIIVYQLIRYIQPLVKKQTMRFVALSGIWSAALAMVGILFGYFIGLPAAMHFLLQGFSSARIEALISIQSYMNFVLVYLLGAALLFQLPLILIIVNKIKPLKPRLLLKQQRWVILGSFVIGAIISPTPDMRNQAMMSGPTILMYEISIFLIWAINRRYRKPKKIVELLRQDAKIQAERIAKFEEAQGMWRGLLLNETATTEASNHHHRTETTPLHAASYRPRPQRYVQEFTRRSYHSLAERSTQPE